MTAIGKRCARCREYLPAEAFMPNPKMRSGLNSWCRPCVAERNRQWRAENPAYVDEANARKRDERRLRPEDVRRIERERYARRRARERGDS